MVANYSVPRSFGLRSLLLVVACICVWCALEINIVHRRQSALRQLRESGARIICNDDEPFGGSINHIRFGDPDEEPGVVRSLLGDKVVLTIIFSHQPTQEQLTLVDSFPEADLLNFVPNR